MDGGGAEPTDQEREELEALGRELDERISENADGSIIVRLLRPVRSGEVSRVTLRPVRVGDVRACRDVLEGRRVEAYTDRLLSPAGILDELESDLDFAAVLRATGRALGKFHGPGKAS